MIVGNKLLEEKQSRLKLQESVKVQNIEIERLKQKIIELEIRIKDLTNEN